MRPSRVLVGPILLGALLATTPQLACGQKDKEEPAPAMQDLRPGEVIESDRMGSLLASNLRVMYPGGVLRAGLRAEVMDREGQVVAKYESKAVEVKAGKTYPGSLWIVSPEQWDEALAPGFGDRRKIRVGATVVINHEEQYMPRGCRDGTHVLRITLAADDAREPVQRPQGLALCLNAER